jgi:hypothetical protein
LALGSENQGAENDRTCNECQTQNGTSGQAL